MNPNLLISGASTLANLIGGAANRRSVQKQNDRSEMYNTLMYNRQRQDALSDWNMQNAYNDPSAQMQRLKAAGLNPNLVYGNGADAQSQSAPRSSSVGQPQFRPKDYDFGSVAQQALMMQQAQANIARTNAETEAIKSRTVGTEFQNSVNKAIGVENMRYKYNVELNRMSQQQKIEMARFDAELAAGFNNGDTRDKNSPAAKAIRAGYERASAELENAQTRGDVLAAEAAIKQYEKRLTDQGISPNSPFYLKTVLSLLEKVGITTNSY